MAWLEKKENWLSSNRFPKKREPVAPIYTVTEFADICRVTRQTVFKWLSIDKPEYAVIPPSGWFRLPSGHIRIRDWVLKKIIKA